MIPIVERVTEEQKADSTLKDPGMLQQCVPCSSDSEEELLFSRKKRKLCVLEDDVNPTMELKDIKVHEDHSIHSERTNEPDSLIQQNPMVFNKDLFDPEDSDEESECQQNFNTDCIKEYDQEKSNSSEKYAENKNCSKKPRKESKITDKRRSKKKRDKELLEIYSESQRLRRQSAPSMPYHKPPKMTLKDFLNRKRKSLLLPELKSPSCDAVSALCLESFDCSNEDAYIVEQNLENISPTEDLSKKTEILSKKDISVHDLSDTHVEKNSQNTNLMYCPAITDNSNKCSDPNDAINSNNSNSCNPKIGEVNKLLPSDTQEETDCKDSMEDACKMSALELLSLSADSCFNTTVKNALYSNNSEAEHDTDFYKKKIEESSLMTKANHSKVLLQADDFCKNSNFESNQSVIGSVNTVSDEEKFSGKLSSIKAKIFCSTSFTPRIIGSPNTVIDLIGNNYSSESDKSNIEKFIEKFVHHTKVVNKKREAQEIKLNIVYKDEAKKETLEVTHINVSVPGNEKDEPTAKKPGSQLLKLKEQLWAKIEKKREEAIERRKKTHQLDNEEVEDPFIEDEEEEMTEESESEKSDTYEDEEEEVEETFVEKRRTKNIFIDDEAEESDEGDNLPNVCAIDSKHYSEIANENYNDNPNNNSIRDDNDLLLENENTQKEKADNRKLLNRSETRGLSKNTSSTDVFQGEEKSSSNIRLYLDSDSEDCTMDPAPLQRDSSFELVGSIIPAYQPGGGLKYSGNAESSDSESERIDLNSSLRSQEKDEQQTEELSEMQIDGSQQLWSTQNIMTSSLASTSGRLWRSNKSILRSTSNGTKLFCGGSSQSDMDNILELCSGKFSDTPVAISDTSISVNEIEAFPLNAKQSSQENMEELLDLCSGKFSSSNCSQLVKSECSLEKVSELYNDSSQPSSNDILALCSGKFSNTTASTDIQVASDYSQNHSLSFQENTGKHLELPTGELNISSLPVSIRENIQVDQENYMIDEDSLPEVSKNRSRPQLLCISDDEDNDKNSNFKSLFDEINEENKTFSDSEENGTFKDPVNEFVETGKNVKEFLEDEAELSGSDIGSDEDEEELGDYYEEDQAPDEDLPSDDELREQIGKVHFKNLMDEDKRELRIYQELYLEDGDLHSDGPGRQRKFVWKNIDGANFDGCDPDSESEKEEAQEDEKWRLERYEREKWLREQEDNKLSVAQSPAKLSDGRKSIKVQIMDKTIETTAVPESKNSEMQNLLFKPHQYMKSRGSFLARGQEYLTGLAKKLKKSEDETAGSRTTKHFVFTTVSPRKAKSNIQSSEKAIVSSTPLQRKSKTVKPDIPSLKKRRSIFDYLDTS